MNVDGHGPGMAIVEDDIHEVFGEDVVIPFRGIQIIQWLHAACYHMAVNQFMAQMDLEALGRVSTDHAGFE